MQVPAFIFSKLSILKGIPFAFRKKSMDIYMLQHQAALILFLLSTSSFTIQSLCAFWNHLLSLLTTLSNLSSLSINSKIGKQKKTAHLLSSERTTLSQLSLTTGWGTQHSWTGITSDSGLGVWENSGDVKTSLTFNIHEEGSWLLNKQLQFVLVSLSSWGWVQ